MLNWRFYFAYSLSNRKHWLSIILYCGLSNINVEYGFIFSHERFRCIFIGEKTIIFMVQIKRCFVFSTFILHLIHHCCFLFGFGCISAIHLKLFARHSKILSFDNIRCIQVVWLSCRPKGTKATPSSTSRAAVRALH